MNIMSEGESWINRLRASLSQLGQDSLEEKLRRGGKTIPPLQGNVRRGGKTDNETNNYGVKNVSGWHEENDNRNVYRGGE